MSDIITKPVKREQLRAKIHQWSLRRAADEAPLTSATGIHIYVCLYAQTLARARAHTHTHTHESAHSRERERGARIQGDHAGGEHGGVSCQKLRRQDR